MGSITKNINVSLVAKYVAMTGDAIQNDQCASFAVGIGVFFSAVCRVENAHDK